MSNGLKFDDTLIPWSENPDVDNKRSNELRLLMELQPDDFLIAIQDFLSERSPSPREYNGYYLAGWAEYNARLIKTNEGVLTRRMSIVRALAHAAILLYEQYAKKAHLHEIFTESMSRANNLRLRMIIQDGPCPGDDILDISHIYQNFIQYNDIALDTAYQFVDNIYTTEYVTAYTNICQKPFPLLSSLIKLMEAGFYEPDYNIQQWITLNNLKRFKWPITIHHPRLAEYLSHDLRQIMIQDANSILGNINEFISGTKISPSDFENIPFANWAACHATRNTNEDIIWSEIAIRLYEFAAQSDPNIKEMSLRLAMMLRRKMIETCGNESGDYIRDTEHLTHWFEYNLNIDLQKAQYITNHFETVPEEDALNFVACLRRLDPLRYLQDSGHYHPSPSIEPWINLREKFANRYW